MIVPNEWRRSRPALRDFPGSKKQRKRFRTGDGASHHARSLPDDSTHSTARSATKTSAKESEILGHTHPVALTCLGPGELDRALCPPVGAGRQSPGARRPVPRDEPMSRAMNPTSTASIPAPAIRPAADAFLAPMDICSQKRPRHPVRDMGKDPLATEAIPPRWIDNPGTRARWADGGGSHPSLAVVSIQDGNRFVGPSHRGGKRSTRSRKITTKRAYRTVRTA